MLAGPPTPSPSIRPSASRMRARHFVPPPSMPRNSIAAARSATSDAIIASRARPRISCRFGLLQDRPGTAAHALLSCRRGSIWGRSMLPPHPSNTKSRTLPRLTGSGCRPVGACHQHGVEDKVRVGGRNGERISMHLAALMEVRVGGMGVVSPKRHLGQEGRIEYQQTSPRRRG